MKKFKLADVTYIPMGREVQPGQRACSYIRTLLYSALFMIIAHGYRYVSGGFSHDSMVINSFMNNEWQISIGRFLQPVYLYLRGGLVAPYLVGLFSILWLSFAAYLIIKLLKPQTLLTEILICGLLAINSTQTTSNATYIPWSDMFMLSLLLSVAGVYVLVNYRWGVVAAPFLFCASLALYQAYFQVAVLLLMMILTLKLLDGASFQEVVKNAVFTVGTLLLSLIVYYVFLQISYAVTGIAAADSYNSLSGVGDYSSESILIVFVKTYLHVARTFIMPETFNMWLSAFVNILIILSVLVMLVQLSKKQLLETRNKVLLALIIVAMPFGANVVYFIAKFMHSLMTYSFVLFYVFALMLAEYFKEDMILKNAEKKGNLTMRTGIVLLTAIILFNGVVFSNQVYFRKELEYQATTAAMNRVVSQMESVDSYVVGETPVALVGSLEQSGIARRRTEFDHLTGVGLQSNLAVTYYSTYEWFLELIWGYPINMLPEEKAVEVSKLDEVIAMPAFPKNGFCKMVDGILVVKLSEGWSPAVEGTNL